jgi:hypothetical protein
MGEVRASFRSNATFQRPSVRLRACHPPTPTRWRPAAECGKAKQLGGGGAITGAEFVAIKAEALA